MTTSTQKADKRPISFILHDMAANTAPVETRLIIRPEDLTRNEPSSLSTVRTLGGAWADSFGPGIPTVNIAGTTGWGGGQQPDGAAAFKSLHDNVFKQWHKLRDAALKNGQDPDLVKLIFADYLDEFIWVVAPQNFILRRNKSRPLLSQYQIQLTWVSDDFKQSMAALEASMSSQDLSVLEKTGIDSLLSSIAGIADFIKTGVTKILGPIKAVFDKLVLLTAKALGIVTGVVNTVKGVVNTVTSGLLGIAIDLTRSATNMTYMAMQIMSMPQSVQAQFQYVAAFFNNAFCVMQNIFRRRQYLPNYYDLYGASNCSSTAGGRPISKYATENPFPAYFPATPNSPVITTPAVASLTRLSSVDTVLNPMSSAQMASDMKIVTSGIRLPNV